MRATTRAVLALLFLLVGLGIASAADAPKPAADGAKPPPDAAKPTAEVSTAPDGPKLGIITGSDKGTYYQFGLDLQKLVRQDADINLTVSTSKGSIENVYAVYQRPGVQLGIVQSDVLAFVARLESEIGRAHV